jgi:hypothetical protein
VLFRSHGGNQANKDMLEDAKAYGLELEPEMLRGADFGVWEDNWHAVELFLRCQTQWRTGPGGVTGGVIGLDYSVVLALATMYLPATAQAKTVLEEVQIMEARALELFAESAKRERS